MSSLGQATLGVQCYDKPLGMSTLGVFCGQVSHAPGGDILERSVRREDPRIREDEEILTVIMAFMEMIE